VLESLTGFSFPQAPGLCTRYATEIACRHEDKEDVAVSIIPRPGADAATEIRLQAFKRTITKLTNADLIEMIEEANSVMAFARAPTTPTPAFVLSATTH
jgi:hypothetical protein